MSGSSTSHLTQKVNDVKSLPPAQRLAENIRNLIRSDMTNAFTPLSPKHYADYAETSVMKVKDGRTGKMLVIAITEEEVEVQ